LTNIRKARPGDVPALFDLINHYARERLLLPRTLTDLYEHFREFLVAEADGRLAGCGALKFYSQSLAEIRSLCVAPGAASHGVGSVLVERLLAEAKASGLESVFALTLAPGFFDKLGFRLQSRETMPMKIWRDCLACPKAATCDEQMMILELAAWRARRPARPEASGRTVEPSAPALAG
jgi:amino-acid N-acetyltransferase